MRTKSFISQCKGDGSQEIFEDDDKMCLEESLVKDTIDLLNLQKISGGSAIDNVIINEFKSNIFFGESFFKDLRFSVIKFPEIPDEDLPISFRYDFYQEYFSIKFNNDPEFLKFSYDPKIFPLLDPLEKGFLSPILFCMLEWKEKMQWNSGRIFVRVFDHRHEPEKEHLICLKISSKAINCFLDEKRSVMDQSQLYELEKNITLIKSPNICLDPSPDVARIKSVFDCNRKMWAIERIRDENDFKPYKEPSSKVSGLNDFKRVKSFGKITAPKIPFFYPDKLAKKV